MRKILTIGLLMLASHAFAQGGSDSLKIESLTMELEKLRSELSTTQDQLQQSERKLIRIQGTMEKQNLQQDQSIDSLENLIGTNIRNLKASEDRLGSQIKETEEQVNSDITGLKTSLSKNTLYWILATGFAILLAVLLFVFLRRMVVSRTDKTTKQLESTRKLLEEESIKLDNKLVEILEKQLIIQKEVSKSAGDKTGEIDHSLALKVADEIVRIQKNLSQMDESTRGKKQLNSSVERIRSNFEANGYEIVDMLNKPYHEGMKVDANFRTDESLDEGQQMITRIIKPQVNFKNEMIQSAQIEVSQNI